MQLAGSELSEVNNSLNFPERSAANYSLSCRRTITPGRVFFSRFLALGCSRPDYLVSQLQTPEEAVALASIANSYDALLAVSTVLNFPRLPANDRRLSIR